MDALPPDPYAALGVAKDATAAAIKAQYRKLVLRLHPDKIQDDEAKKAAVDEFHKVQTSYEILSDDERRQRYDAQCKLERLRKEAMERGGVSTRTATDARSSPYRAPADSSYYGDYFARGPERSGRMSPQYEERRPNFTDYFDHPRPMSRKDSDFDRSSKRGAPPREDPKRSRASARKSKENERSEKARKADQDMRKDRDRKHQPFVSDESPTGDSDGYERAWKQRRDDDERPARQAMEDDARRRREEEEAAASFFGNDRAHKLYRQDSDAREYMARGGSAPQDRQTTERRPSPERKASSRDKVEYIKREDGRPPVMIRRGSGRPDSSRDPRKSSSREKDIQIVDEPQETPRKPNLSKMQSSPADIRLPHDKQRAQSLQFDHTEPPVPGIKRAETMPYPTSDSRRKEGSKLRTEIRDGYPTPESSPEPPSLRKYNSAREYTREDESPTTDGYRTEVREPASGRKITRSPSPIREPRDKGRSSNSKYSSPHPPTPKRTTSTSYVYPTPVETTEARRPSVQREFSEPRRPSLQRDGSGALFGEIPTTRRSQGKYTPPVDDIKYSPKPRPEDIKAATGYKVREVRRPHDKPYSSRQGTPVYAR